jgi:hypothetical protein
MVQREMQNLGFDLLRIKEKWEGPKLHFGDFYMSRKGADRWYILESKGIKSNSEDWHKLNNQSSLTRFLRNNNQRLELFKSDAGLLEWVSRYHTSDLNELKKRIRVLETHFVSGTGTAGREIATPRKDEFDYISLDLFLRTNKREFIFADPQELESSNGHPAHLQQNYVVDILLEGVRTEPVLRPPWHRSIMEIWDDNKEPVRNEQRQIDTRSG